MARKRSGTKAPQQCSSNLKQCSSNLTTVKRQLVNEQNRLKFLERQLEVAMNSRQAREQATHALLVRLSRDVNSLRNQLRSKNEQLFSIKESIQQSVDSNLPQIEAKYQQDIAQLRQQYEATIVELSERHRRAIEQMSNSRGDYDSLSLQLRESRNREEQLDRQLDQYERKLQEVEKQLERADKRGDEQLVRKCEAEIDRYESRISELENLLERQAQISERRDEESQRLKEQYDERLSRQQAELEDNIRRSLEECTDARERRVAELTREYEQRLATLSAELESQRETNRMCQRDVTECVSRMRDAGANIPPVSVPITEVKEEKIVARRGGPPAPPLPSGPVRRGGPPAPPPPQSVRRSVVPLPKVDDERQALLAAIQRGKQLKKTTPRSVPRKSEVDQRSNLLKAIAQRRQAIESDSENDEDWD